MCLQNQENDKQNRKITKRFIFLFPKIVQIYIMQSTFLKKTMSCVLRFGNLQIRIKIEQFVVGGDGGNANYEIPCWLN